MANRLHVLLQALPVCQREWCWLTTISSTICCNSLISTYTTSRRVRQPVSILYFVCVCWFLCPLYEYFSYFSAESRYCAMCSFFWKTASSPSLNLLLFWEIASCPLSRLIYSPLLSFSSPGDVVAGVLPFFHIYGQTVIMNHAPYRGIKCVVFPKWARIAFDWFGLVLASGVFG